MAQAPSPPLIIWAVSDGRAGIEAQALGLAEAVARLRPAEILVKRVGWKAGFGRLPWWANPLPRLTVKADGRIGPPWPNIWIATGRATLPLSLRMRRWSQGRTFVVQTQDPRTPLAAFDLVIPPGHDGREGANVFPIVGAPNRITSAQIAAALERFHDVVDPLPQPRVAVIIGGRSRAFDLPGPLAAELGRQIAAAIASAGGSLMLSFTRRTPPAAREALTRELRGTPGIIWDGAGDNPYFAFLGAADAILVTEDSTNLATDAASTGKPVYVLRMGGAGAKFRRFHDELRLRGVTRPFSGVLEHWSYPPFVETDRAAKELLRRYDARNLIP
jgi:mitochondrial fission protein ELM1